jgi:hypothetical protein
MPRNNLQILFNELEREAEQAESVFLLADKNRHTLKAAYASLLSTLNGVQGKLGRYPQAAALKRIKLIETLLKDLLLRHETERRHFNALGFLLSRLRTNLATEILEPRLYGKIRTALENETNLVRLREKFPDAESVITAPALPVKKPAKPIRLLLLGAAGLHFAIPVQKLVKKTAPGPIAEKLQSLGYISSSLPTAGAFSVAPKLFVAYRDLRGAKRMVQCDAYFTPVQMTQKSLKDRVSYTASPGARPDEQRGHLTFYGRRFFLYGARLTYTVRTGDRTRAS